MSHPIAALLSVLTVTAFALAGDAPSARESAGSAQRARVLRGTLGTYAGPPRTADKHVDVNRLLADLIDLKVNTYNWLIWHEPTDWEDLQKFLPMARAADIRVWVTLVPPSESPPRARSFSEPFRLDYEKWAAEIARLSLREPALVAWSIDDFLHNTGVFSPDKLRPIITAARGINPDLAFIPCWYYAQVKRGLARDYGDLIDGVLFPYRNESRQANLKDAGQVESEVKDLRGMLGAGLPIIVDVYATAHSRLGASTPEYVDQVIQAAHESADGVMIYCHQDPAAQADKYAVTRALFRRYNPEGPFLVPRLEGSPWVVARDPDLGEFTHPKQQPVDFGVWQAADGTWQLWSCIRNTKCGGNTRLLYRWEGPRLTEPDWKPMGIAMQADAQFGETPGGLQAPHVARNGDDYVMVYGDWVHICLARSKDGKQFDRWLTQDGKAGRFSEGGAGANTRDPMLLQVDGRWHCYYTGTPEWRGYDFCRISENLVDWSESRIVSYGGRSGRRGNSTECPFVAFRGGHYYLFRTQYYGKNATTHVYRSKNPLQFNLGDDAGYVCTLPVAAPEIITHEGQDYIAYLLPTLKGIQISRLTWDTPRTSPPAASGPG